MLETESWVDVKKNEQVQRLWSERWPEHKELNWVTDSTDPRAHCARLWHYVSASMAHPWSKKCVKNGRRVQDWMYLYELFEWFEILAWKCSVYWHNWSRCLSTSITSSTGSPEQHSYTQEEKRLVLFRTSCVVLGSLLWKYTLITDHVTAAKFRLRVCFGMCCITEVLLLYSYCLQQGDQQHHVPELLFIIMIAKINEESGSEQTRTTWAVSEVCPFCSVQTHFTKAEWFGNNHHKSHWRPKNWRALFES